MMNPKVTIIMATYNRAHYIVETLQSIQSQSYTNWECLIIDDGGTDNTYEIIIPILEKDNRFQFLKRPKKYKKGLPGCRNYGLDLAKGDYIIFFDDDDIAHSDNLKTCVEVLEVNNVDFCNYQKLAFEGAVPDVKNHPISILQNISRDNIEKIVIQEIGFASCTVMWKKYCFDHNCFNENLLYAEEWECYTKLLTEGFKGLMINNVLYYNRKHPDSNTGEFYRHNTLRRASKKEAIVLVLQNLKQKKLLSPFLERYFIQLSLSFKEFDLFYQVLDIMQLSDFGKVKWQLFYFTLPLRLSIFGVWKKIKKSY